jgi:hypothetical protein
MLNYIYFLFGIVGFILTWKLISLYFNYITCGKTPHERFATGTIWTWTGISIITIAILLLWI